ncbi:MAG: ABC transporter permease [Weeksellaceae bacterium]
MEYNEIIRASIVALKSNLMRTALTMLGIIIGIGSVIMIASIGQSAVAYVNEEFSSFGTNYFQINPGQNAFSGIGGGSSNPLTLDDAQVIEDAGMENIISVAPFAFASTRAAANDKEIQVSVYGVTAPGQSLLNPTLVYGNFLTDADSNSRVALIGIDAAEELFGADINPVGETLRINGSRYRIIGLTESESDLTGGFFNSSIILPLDIVSEQIRGDDELFEIDVSVANTDYINQTMDDVEVLLRDARDLEEGTDNDFNMTSFIDSLETINSITSLLTALIAGISSISLIVGGVGVMNIMLVSVTERTKEIGLLKSIGAKNNDILTQFLIESVVMSVIGGVIGIVIGILGAFLISLAFGIPFILSIPWIIIAVVASTLVGIIFGLYPARRAAALSPIDALRYE